MRERKWFSIPLRAGEADTCQSALASVGFVLHASEYTDESGRVVRLTSPAVHIGIPPSDTVSEQEQLEFIVGLLGLDEDTIEAL